MRTLKEIQRSKSESSFIVQGIFEDDNLPKGLIKNEGVLTEYTTQKEAFLYLGKRDDLSRSKLITFLKPLMLSTTREMQLDVASLLSAKIILENLIYDLVVLFNYQRAKLFTKKERKSELKDFSIFLSNPSDKLEEIFLKASIHATSQTFARQMQILPPNIATSEYLAEQYKSFAQSVEGLSVEVLDRTKITELQMNLLLAVNAGSTFEPRVVVIEYHGDPDSDEKIALVGKGIAFDAGGYNIKSSMVDMKYDMSGSAIVVGAIVGAAKMKVKKNIVAVAPLTDNRLNGNANLPDNVIVSMSGKAVEITNTDAEGRLILADALTYAQRNKKAQTVIDIATLTGAMKYALGYTYVGTWSTDQGEYDKMAKAASHVNENIWQMPFDKAFLSPGQKTKVADIRNSDLTGLAGSGSAAMFVNFFIEKGVKHLHFDIAATAKIGSDFTGVMTRTFIEYLSQD